MIQICVLTCVAWAHDEKNEKKFPWDQDLPIKGSDTADSFTPSTSPSDQNYGHVGSEMGSMGNDANLSESGFVAPVQPNSSEQTAATENAPESAGNSLWPKLHQRKNMSFAPRTFLRF